MGMVGAMVGMPARWIGQLDIHIVRVCIVGRQRMVGRGKVCETMRGREPDGRHEGPPDQYHQDQPTQAHLAIRQPEVGGEDMHLGTGRRMMSRESIVTSGGGYTNTPAMHTHETHPAAIKRLRRAGGHLASVIAMLEQGRPCLDVAQQLQAVEKAVAQAKKTLIQDHLDHCLRHMVAGSGEAKGSSLEEFRLITKYL